MLARRARALIGTSHLAQAWPPRARGLFYANTTAEGGEEEDEERSRAGVMKAPVETKRQSKDDVIVMHPDTSRGIEVLHNPVYAKGT